MMVLFTLLSVVIFSQVYTNVKTYQIVYLKYVLSFLCQLYVKIV